MIKDIELFHINDFADYGRDAALVIANELNRLLLGSAEDLSSNGDITLSELKNDMRAAPHLYLSDPTIKELGLVRFSSRTENK